MHYFKDNPPAVEPILLSVADKLKFAGDRRWWMVKAVSRHFAALTRQAEFERAGTLCYTVVDWRNGVRGPCDLIGQGYGDGSYSEAECERMLAQFEAPDEQAGDPDNYVMPLHVSQRNWLPIEIRDVRAAVAA